MPRSPTRKRASGSLAQSRASRSTSTCSGSSSASPTRAERWCRTARRPVKPQIRFATTCRRHGRERERRGLVRHPAPFPGHDVAERDPVVEDAHVEDGVGSACRVPQRNARPVEPIGRLGMHAARGVVLIRAVGLDLARLHALPQVHAIDEDTERRGLDHRPVPEGDTVGQARPVGREQRDLDGAIRAGNPNGIARRGRPQQPGQISRQRGRAERRGDERSASHQRIPRRGPTTLCSVPARGRDRSPAAGSGGTP